MSKGLVVLIGVLACAACAEGEGIDDAMLGANAASGGGGYSGTSVSPNTGGDSTTTGTESGGSNGQSGSTGQSGSNGQSGSGSGTGGSPQSDASVGTGGQSGTGGNGGSLASGGNAGSAGSGGSSMPMSDAGFIAGFQVLYKNDKPTATSPYIGCELQAKNGGSSTAGVNEFKVRYYLTKDIAGAPVFHLNWAYVKNAGGQWDAMTTETFNTLTPSKNNADSYFEFSFTSAAHTNLSPNDMIYFSWQVQGPDPSKDNFTQSNDYSWDMGRTMLQQWDHVVLLRNDTVVWGTPP
jgi:hypothetical protein